MKARLEKTVEAVRTSMWFLPSVLAVLAIAGALGLIELDRRIEPRAVGVPGLIFHGGPEGARAVLSAVASSMMTVTGVTFSITVVALTLASQQYTPRVLRHFTSDRGNQVVLGTFIGTFVYCLLVLRTVRSDRWGQFIPNIAVTGGVVLAVTSLGLLIYFIHHVATMIQPSSIIARVAASTGDLIDHLFPERLGNDTAREVAEEALSRAPSGGMPIPASHGGYVQAVDLEALMRVAREEDLVVRMEHAVGEYVPREAVLATVWPRGPVHHELAHRVNRCFAFGRDRSMQQDPEYGIVQLSDIAVKALSPGINDPTTAMTCLDTLGELLERLGRRQLPSRYRKDDAGDLRVIALHTDFARMADLAFSQIRHYGQGDAEVTTHLLRVLARLAKVVAGVPERRDVIRCHLEEIRAGMERGIRSSIKREQVRQQLREAHEALEGPPATGGRAEPGGSERG